MPRGKAETMYIAAVAGIFAVAAEGVYGRFLSGAKPLIIFVKPG
jgi:hypothetical protein